jgi:hypothetical protein
LKIRRLTPKFQARQSEQAAAPSFSALLLQLPKDDQAFERLSVEQRDVEL